MTIDALSAARSYADVARIAGDAGRMARADAPADFGALVKAAVAETAGSLKAGEAAAMEVAAGGEAGLVDVVTAVSAAELSLETAIAIRNKVVEAYQEIMRMPI